MGEIIRISHPVRIGDDDVKIIFSACCYYKSVDNAMQIYPEIHGLVTWSQNLFDMIDNLYIAKAANSQAVRQKLLAKFEDEYPFED
jgi:hypothetical protein